MSKSELAVGDTVVAIWDTPKTGIRQIRGRVSALTPTRATVEYIHEKNSGGSINAEIRTKTLTRELVRKVKPKPGEQSPQAYMRELVHALAGKPLRARGAR